MKKKFFPEGTPISKRLSYFDHAKPNRKYNGAGNWGACGQCQQSRHSSCRIRQDDVLCKCDCPRAVEIRNEIETYIEGCKALNREIPSNEAISIELGHRKRKVRSR